MQLQLNIHLSQPTKTKVIYTVVSCTRIVVYIFLALNFLYKDTREHSNGMHFVL